MLALHIHGDMGAVVATLHRVRPLARREIQPLIGRLARHKHLGGWIEEIVRNG